MAYIEMLEEALKDFLNLAKQKDHQIRRAVYVGTGTCQQR